MIEKELYFVETANRHDYDRLTAYQYNGMLHLINKYNSLILHPFDNKEVKIEDEYAGWTKKEIKQVKDWLNFNTFLLNKIKKYNGNNL